MEIGQKVNVWRHKLSGIIISIYETLPFPIEVKLDNGETHFFKRS